MGSRGQSMDELTMSPELASMLRAIRDSLGMSTRLSAGTSTNLVEEAAQILGLEAECDGLKTLRAKASRLVEELNVKGDSGTAAIRARATAVAANRKIAISRR